MNPANAIAPIAEKRRKVNEGNGEAIVLVGFDPIRLPVIAEKIRTTYAMPIMTGIIIAIKLAVKPNFLPDSNDILTNVM